MTRVCPKCSRTMDYDSYFNAEVCRQCGHSIKRAVRMPDSRTQRLLIKLAEECGEVQQAVSKFLLYGALSSHSKYGNVKNCDLVAQECGDVLGMIRMLVEDGALNGKLVTDTADAKPSKVEHYVFGDGRFEE